MSARSESEIYKNAGVDITAGYKAVELIKPMVKSTFTKGVLGGIGGFGGAFEPPLAGLERPVFVSGTDGVGTKLKLAFLADKHDTVGIDCVAMCVNDIVCAGATPLFFLDYIACGKNIPEKIASVVSGVAEGCRQSGAALVGGETAEMPGFYPVDEYDLAGFSVGMVDYPKMITGDNLEPGDALIGLASSGVHSNGFSLVRKVFGVGEKDISFYSDELGHTLIEELLTPTRIYVKPMLELISQVNVKAVSHITGGGFYENVPRMMKKGVCAMIRKSAFTVPPIFRMIARAGGVSERDMYNTYNMGIGMIAAVPGGEADRAVELLRAAGVEASVIGECAAGEGGIELW